MVSYATRLPSDEELSVPHEIHMSTPALRASALHMAKYCEPHCKEFMLCRREEEDPRNCLREGKEVTACGIKFLQQVKKLCLNEFEMYAHCIDHSHEQLRVGPCLAKSRVFDKCIYDHLAQERPKLGYFMTPMAHKTNRPLPVDKLRDYEAEAAKLVKMDELPDDVQHNEDFRRFSRLGTAAHEWMDGV